MLRPKAKKQLTKSKASDGTEYTQEQIRAKLSEAYRKQDYEEPITYCEACGEDLWFDHDHTISQKTCKALHKTELIWDSRNWSRSCRSCHMEWESYKSGKFKLHKNYIRRMLFLRKHDPEGYRKRLYA